jgi:hypothetical protein
VIQDTANSTILIRYIPCGHTFCKRCAYSVTCPTCRGGEEGEGPTLHTNYAIESVVSEVVNAINEAG